MTLASPWYLLIILLLPLFFIPFNRGKKKQGLFFSTNLLFQTLGTSLRQRLRFLPQVLCFLGMILLVIALSRPREPLGEERKITEGVAIQLVIDRSSSMNAEVEVQGSFVRRMDITRKTFQDFVFGNGKDLPGRGDDLIGLIAFAKYADTLSPLSGSHDILEDFLGSIDTVTSREEDGTSIGDAIALASARLAKVDKADSPGDNYSIKSKIIVLLTDGENNSGERSPLEAAEFARDLGIKIYSIGFGGEAYQNVQGLLGRQRIPYAAAVDEETLQTISSITGGSYFQVRSPEDLYEVYREIDGLEKSEVLRLENPRYRELFYLPAILGLILLAGAFLFEQTIFRRFP